MILVFDLVDLVLCLDRFQVLIRRSLGLLSSFLRFKDLGLRRLRFLAWLPFGKPLIFKFQSINRLPRFKLYVRAQLYRLEFDRGDYDQG